MRKLLYTSLALASLWACSKDDDTTTSSSSNYSVSATVGSASFSVAQNSGGISAANSGGSTQINAITSDDKGFKFFIPETTALGTHSLDTSSISITYSNDWLVFGNYIVNDGTINITSFEAWPAALKASFEGWGFNNTNSDDSIYFSSGLADVKL